MRRNSRSAASEWGRAGLLATSMALTSGLVGDSGAAQPLPRVVTHGPVEAKVIDRAERPGGIARRSFSPALGYRPNLAAPSPGSGDPVCGGGSVAWHGQPLPDGEQGTLSPLDRKSVV